jgi:hypothetical protein
MNTKCSSQLVRRLTVLGVAFALAPLARAQSQTQSRGQNGQVVQIAKLNDTAQPSPIPPAGGAGTMATSTDTPKPAAASADQPVSLAVIEELDALKKRVEELEAELKGKPEAEQPAPSAMESPAGLAADPLADAEPTERIGVPTLRPLPTLASAVGSQVAGAKPEVKDVDPFSLYDYTWLNGNSRNEDTPLAVKYFTPEFRADSNFIYDGNHPIDHTMGGSTESFRSGELELEQLSFGGDLRVGNVRGRVLTMFGMFATTTPRNDASAGVGQWDYRDAYRYVSEAWGGYHWNINHHGGLNVDAGIFVSYIGLFSYYNFDNWTYQPSYVSSNTPWFFNGLRIQYFPSAKLKIEPWIINGWQSYAKFNGHPGLGGQILWRPTGWFSAVFNNYGMGTDVLGNPGISRIHTDDSVEVKYFDHKDSLGLDKMAFSFTGDLGCQYGGAKYNVNTPSGSAGFPYGPTGAVSCFGGKGVPQDAFLGWMVYNRFWFHKDLFAVTLGGGQMSNPGRYLTLLQPINGADAVSGSPYFTEFAGQTAKMWDGTVTLDYMPSQFFTIRFEGGYRHSNVPYWSGPGGITPPGGNTGAPGAYVCTNGSFSMVDTLTPVVNGYFNGDAPQVAADCKTLGGVNERAWAPDLKKGQAVGTVAFMVKF